MEIFLNKEWKKFAGDFLPPHVTKEAAVDECNSCRRILPLWEFRVYEALVAK